MVYVTQWYMLHNGICYTMVYVTQWYILHNGISYTMVYVTLPLCFVQPHDVIQNNRKNDASYKKMVLKLKNTFVNFNCGNKMSK